MTNSRTAPRFPEWPQYDDTERSALTRALEQGQWWRVGGGEVDAFEREFAALHGGGHALAVTNGTHALELALQVLGVGPGDEVIVPAFTFISSSQAAQRLGATAVPVDVDLATYNIDPAAAEAAITARTKVIMPVHMAGRIADLDALGKVAERAGVALLQDAAHAHGAEWKGRKVGELGSVAAFSFQNGKLMTAGEGGLVLFPDEEGRDLAFVRHSCGRPPGDTRYLHRTSGSNFRLNEFSAAVLRAQLSRLTAQVETRERRAAVLEPLLAGVPGVVPQGRDERATRVPHYMAMFRVPGIGEERRNALVAELVRRGLPAFVVFRAIYRTDGFWETGAPDATREELAERCPNTELIHAEGIWLHHRTLLAGEDEVRAIPEIIADALETL
ncbi:aminotransferase class I/II-fold pyridoxal phosphate-dependent enzyme [Actinomadura macrotermitis]|uniref:aminotransferase class I/II-fold pyridoxal phosphate-dependent enzyme n=1 Tax=Actinomadura macrotermitis TaxID=2585200 RepID=UPI001F3F74F8|nr:aminotransferase class I/II-fold pyridoxal phosphate-dependent enzyme [Actinomadura macrotermitis]